MSDDDFSRTLHSSLTAHYVIPIHSFATWPSTATLTNFAADCEQMSSLSAAELALFKRGIAFIKANPDALHQPEYAFVKDYLNELGARIPAKKAATPEPKADHSHHGMLVLLSTWDSALIYGLIAIE